MLRERPLAQLFGTIRNGPEGLEADPGLLPLVLGVPAHVNSLDALLEILADLLERLAWDFDFKLSRLVDVGGGVEVSSGCFSRVFSLLGLSLAFGISPLDHRLDLLGICVGRKVGHDCALLKDVLDQVPGYHANPSIQPGVNVEVGGKVTTLQSLDFGEWEGGLVGNDPVPGIMKRRLGSFPVLVAGIVRLGSSGSSRRSTAAGFLRFGRPDEGRSARGETARPGVALSLR